MASRNSQSKQIRLFRDERLEKLTVISPGAFAVLWGLALPAISWIGWGSATPLGALLLFAGGLIFWSLFEYAMHRYLFHWESTVPLVRQFVFLMHGNHHAEPNDLLRNLMPPIVSIPIASSIWALCVLLFGPVGTWVFLGYIVGYVAYDLTHFACHQWPMRGRLAHMLKRHHMRHHHVGQDGNYAITALFWDRVFGSAITSLKPRGDGAA
jgi:sterol desaturase/sphingolipid hydroxylase (fatty acid hydroxylase superfamily)